MSSAARLLSLAAAGVLALGLMLTPQVLGQRVATGIGHGGLSLALLGMAGCFVYGFGYRPDTLAVRVLFSPWIAWPLMAGGLWIVAGPA
jgi:predicted membrane protein